VAGKAILGFSTHDAEQLERADTEPADYLSLGPIFATTSKLRPDPVVGLPGLQKLRPLTAKPLVAIGGINPENAVSVLAAGADSVAVISAILPASGDQEGLRRLTRNWLELTVR
jgi:thiamine-phosphate pyrophosphorylase